MYMIAGAHGGVGSSGATVRGGCELLDMVLATELWHLQEQ